VWLIPEDERSHCSACRYFSLGMIRIMQSSLHAGACLAAGARAWRCSSSRAALSSRRARCLALDPGAKVFDRVRDMLRGPL
jgi:hypothetical protein